MNSNTDSKNQRRGQANKRMAVHAVALMLCMAATDVTAQSYTVLHNFVGSDGGFPSGELVVSGTTLYGTTGGGGSYGKGTVFKMNTDGSDYAVLHSFSNGPAADLVLAGTTLFGTTMLGGSSGGGTVFKVNTDGSGYAVLHNFSGGWGDGPAGGLVLAGTTLYGATHHGGDFNKGTVFKINTDGNGYTVLHSFTGGDGASVNSGLVLDGATLYGRTHEVGGFSYGTVFKVNTDGSGYTLLHNFSGADGSFPNGNLVLSGTTLYGTTSLGGYAPTNCGTVFKVNTDGTGFEVLRSFSGRDGYGPSARMVLVGSRLYGTTYNGGTGYIGGVVVGNGTIFTLKTDGSGYIVLKYYAGVNESDGSLQADGARPRGALVLSGTTMYGTTDIGGSGVYGVVFKFQPPFDPPTMLASPSSQTAEVGSTVLFKPVVAGDPVMTYQWFFNDMAISGCTTNCVLRTSGVQFTNAGKYTVLVTNLLGAATSAPAVLNVIPPVERRPVPALDLLGETGSTLNVEYADALGSPTNWLPLDTVDLAATTQLYLDVTAPLPPQRFYRVRQAGTPVVPPSVNPPIMVPAITLTGNIGDQLRLDCINQFGPTNAWVNLDTVTLTNTSQLYFDTSAPSQPRRLYRIVPVP